MTPPPSLKSENVTRAIIAGLVVVNGPVMLCIFGAFLLGYSQWGPGGAVGGTLVGAAVGWLWWSFMVPRWRAWALARVVDPNKLHTWAVGLGIEWPKGSIFEKTEFRSRK